ncbi:hypothetical protein [Demequina sp. NBRC 110055]|uniref:hypothetical protein n=1 Tax=Demequina sp. NBRC 110055 TaxID=1570344 RepID=UPI000A0145D6|nr:hypothetical protein [Demequina sp. NBRC 110055]
MNRRPRLALVAAMVSLGALAAVPVATQAVWTDDAWFSGTVAAGDWSEGGGGSGGGGGIDPGDNTDIVDITWTVASPLSSCAIVEVTTTSDTPVEWSITVDPDERPWNHDDPSQIQVNNGGQIVEPRTSPLVIVGNTDSSGSFSEYSNNTPIEAGQVAKVEVCGYNNEVPPPEPDNGEWYTWSVSAPVTSPGQVCSTLTVQGLVDEAEDPFFYGWGITIDIQPAIDAYLASGATVYYVGSTPSPSSGYEFTFTQQDPPNENLVYIQSGTAMALQGTDVQTLEVCVYGAPP